MNYFKRSLKSQSVFMQRKLRASVDLGISPNTDRNPEKTKKIRISLKLDSLNAHSQPSLDTVVTETTKKRIKFVPKSFKYIQLSPSPVVHNLKGKISQKDKDLLTKILENTRSSKKISEIHTHLRNFINKTNKKQLTIKKTSKHYHPEEKLFFKEVKNGNLEAVKELIARHPKLVFSCDSTDQTALHWACKRGFANLVEFLIFSKSSIEALDIIRRKPEDLARSRGFYDIASLIQSSRKILTRSPTKILS